MKVLAGGDSFVWGSELSDSPHGGPNGYSKKTFPAQLSKKEYCCVAYPGIGNKEIVHRILSHLAWAKKPNLVIVCWTWPSRDNELDSDVHIKTLQEHLEYHNIPYLFTCADNCVVTGKLDYTNWFMFPAGTEEWQTKDPRGFYQWARENKYPVGKELHPLEEAHAAAAQLLKDKINEMVKEYI
tara:strand:- start:36 stop:584 length:549 start_codon:yes stop_codon:yes gene_type:complete